jgi:hypothetical protein
VVDQTLWGFAQTPRSSKEPIEICPEHGAGVVEGKERVEAEFFELSLPGDAASSSLRRDVPGFGVVPL